MTKKPAPQSRPPWMTVVAILIAAGVVVALCFTLLKPKQPKLDYTNEGGGPGGPQAAPAQQATGETPASDQPSAAQSQQMGESPKQGL